MKRKKWSEVEEQTLLTKYSDLLNSGTLPKLKTREKKFKPIADHVNSAHHLQDPLNFPFKWSWRDVSIKVQNMRHQYLGVKQKIRSPNGDFIWKDGENHWENFLIYKQVFGDVELEVKDNNKFDDVGLAVFADDFEDDGDLGFGIYSDELEDEDDDDDDVEVEVEVEETTFRKGCGGRRSGLVGAQVLELRDVVMRREERRRDREWSREEGFLEREDRKREREFLDHDDLEIKEMELEQVPIRHARREFNRSLRVEREFYEERRRRLRMEEKREEEEMEWREKMVNIQIQHEKQMMQMHADACQNQMQILGLMARLVCQFFGSANDGLGTLPNQVLQNLQHPGGMGDNGKPDASSPSEFL